MTSLARVSLFRTSWRAPAISRAVVLTSLLHWAIASATLIFTRDVSSIATFWPPNAVILAAIWTLPRRQWTPFLIGGFLANTAANLVVNTLPVSMAFAAVNITEVAVAGLLLGQTTSSARALGTLARVIGFFLRAGVIAPAIAAIGGAAIVTTVFDANFLRAYATWFAADSLGLLVFGPLALLVRTGELWNADRRMSRSELLQAVAMLSAVLIAALIVFSRGQYPLLFLVFTPVVFSACKLGRGGATLSLVIVAIVGSILTLQGYGPISHITGDDGQRILFFQLFLAVLLMTALPAAAEMDERRALIATLAEREDMLTRLMEQSADLVLHLDTIGDCVFVSGSDAGLEAYAPSVVVGRNIADLPHAEDTAKVTATLQRAIRQPGISHRCEYRLRGADGNWTWVEANVRALLDTNGVIGGTVSAIRDVTHHKRREADLYLAAKTDALTGIANRAGFIERLDRALETAPAETLWVGMLDIDHFKTVNDTHGHAAGDDVLRAVADRLRLELRQGDGIGRVGGEEFAIILSGVDCRDAERIAGRLRESIARKPIELSSGVSLLVTLSGGFVPVKAGQARDALLSAADDALYASKREGRNRMTIAA